MKRYLIIGGYKKQLNTNFKGKCPYLRNLYKKEREILEKVEMKKIEIIAEKIYKNNSYQRDYSFFAHTNPEVIKIKKFPQINLSTQLKHSIISQEERYRVKNKEKEDKFVHIYKNNSIYFPRAIEKYNSRKKKNKSKSYVHLPNLF